MNNKNTAQIGTMKVIRQEVAWYVVESDLQSLYRFDAVNNDKQFKTMLEQMLKYVSDKFTLPAASDNDSVYVVIDQKLHPIKK